jgi:hypothetical protein
VHSLRPLLHRDYREHSTHFTAHTSQHTPHSTHHTAHTSYRLSLLQVAAALGGGRTAAACLTAWQQVLRDPDEARPASAPRAFSAEEDQLLLALVVKHNYHWERVAADMGLARLVVKERHRKLRGALGTNRGQWEEHEDRALEQVGCWW